MKQLIINADDFGINESVTAEIEKMIESQAISSTTVMANGKCLDEVKRFANLHSEVSYGVHLCLSEFDSVTKSEALVRAGLTDANGQFIHKAIFELKNLNKKDVQQVIINELNAQIDIVSSLGFSISHADSHHHVHTIYPLREVFAEVLIKRGIKKVRLGEDFRTFRTKRHLLIWLRRINLNKFYKSIFTTTDSFYKYADFIKKELQNNETVVELMCHPGHTEQQFRDEMKLVEAKAALRGNDVKLITYNDLY